VSDSWIRPRPTPRQYRDDAIIAVVIALGAATTALLYARVGMYEEPAPVWVSTVVIAFISLPLALRRRYPELIAIVISIAFFVGQQFSVPEVLFSNISLFVAIYTVGAWGESRRRATMLRIAIIIGMFLWVAVNLIISVSDPDLMPDVSRSGIFSQFASFAVINVLTNVLYFGGAYYFGDSAHAAARQRALLEARTTELDRERERVAEQAVALDRVRIARELHDVVAHHVSVMGVQAGAARRVLRDDPDQAATSLATIEQSARTAVDELHRMLTTLREEGTAIADAAQPTPATEDSGGARGASAASTSSSTRGIDQLPELVAECTAAGTPAGLTVIGDARPITGIVGFTLYRIAQESLTNVRKHAGDRATADVRLRYLPGGVELEVSDDGQGRRLRTDGTGHGQVGMRERVVAVGGTIEMGPKSRGGYRVRASIPEAVPPRAPEPAHTSTARVDS
jgi:signal transduction histidine kinase